MAPQISQPSPVRSTFPLSSNWFTSLPPPLPGSPSLMEPLVFIRAAKRVCRRTATPPHNTPPPPHLLWCRVREGLGLGLAPFYYRRLAEPLLSVHRKSKHIAENLHRITHTHTHTHSCLSYNIRNKENIYKCKRKSYVIFLYQAKRVQTVHGKKKIYSVLQKNMENYMVLWLSLHPEGCEFESHDGQKEWNLKKKTPQTNKKTFQSFFLR